MTNFLFAQNFAVGLNKMIVFYLGIDNPVTIAVENCPCNQVVVKTTNGTLSGKGCNFILRVKERGASEIMVYKKNGNRLKEIGVYGARVKEIPLPTFKIGYYGLCQDKITSNHIKTQKWGKG
jgi:hypothetical protein